MDINVKNLEPEVVRRLAEQAKAENMSQQEWFRQVLARAAGRLSPAELVWQRQALSPMSNSEFEKAMTELTKRRRSTTEQIRASKRRR